MSDHDLPNQAAPCATPRPVAEALPDCVSTAGGNSRFFQNVLVLQKV